ncbi:hypothetical protein AB4428_06530, partial [Vibrio lentus]
SCGGGPMYREREFRTKEWDECVFPKLDKTCGELAVGFLKADEATVAQVQGMVQFQGGNVDILEKQSNEVAS